MDFPVFIPAKKKVRFFMPHFPIFTGTVHSYNPDKVKYLLNLLQNPQNKLKNVIHVVGTNGKGSVCSYLKYILMESGFKVNTYTSPHLHAANERIDINGNKIEDNMLFYYVEKVRILCEEENIDITIFECLTIAGIIAFSETEADFNIIEAGMGGENDATNVFDKSNLAAVILTSISLDHTRFLGNTQYEIALQKLGVLREGCPLIVYPCTKEVLKAVLEKAEENKAFPMFYGRDYNTVKLEFENGNFGVHYKFFDEEIILPLPRLIGDHQIFNMITSITALKSLHKINISTINIENAIKKVKWPGRLERVLLPKLTNLLRAESEIWFDGAHNPGGALALANWLSSQKDTCYENFLIIGKTKGSEAVNFVSAFKNFVKAGIAIEVKGEVFPESKFVLKSALERAEISSFIAQDLEEAMKIIEKNTIGKARVIICGSLYLARDINFYS